MTKEQPPNESPPEVGDSYVHVREFTLGEVRQFAELSGDTQPRHVEPNEDGRLLVHGLLTASILTKIGGDLEMLAYHLDLNFRHPVFTGDTITCTWTNDAVKKKSERYHVIASVICRNQQDEIVLEATVRGYLL